MLKFYHPICHLIHGERLYYILLETKNTVSGNIDLVKELLEKESQKLRNSYSAYLVFGTCDLLIRVWAKENNFRLLLEALKNNQTVVQTTVYMINSLNTYYQRKIEENAEWPGQIGLDDYKKIMTLETPDSYCTPFEKSLEQRYFMFLKEPYTKETRFFSEISTSLKEKDNRYLECFDGIHKISIYSYLCKEYQGVLVTGETNDLNEIAKSTKNISEAFDVSTTTTYICFKRLPADKPCDSISEGKKAYNDLLPEIAYNLLKSHDCYERLFKDDERERKNTFCAELGRPDILPEILNYNCKDWWGFIQDSTKIFKWIVGKKNGPFIDFLRGQYVFYENLFNKDLNKYKDLMITEDKSYMRMLRKHTTDTLLPNKKMSVSEQALRKFGDKIKNYFLRSSKADEKDLTFGDLSRLLGLLSQKCKLQKEQSKKIKRITESISNCINNRNAIMHGRILNLFGTDKDGKLIWKEYALNIIKLNIAYQAGGMAYSTLLNKLKTGQ